MIDPKLGEVMSVFKMKESPMPDTTPNSSTSPSAPITSPSAPKPGYQSSEVQGAGLVMGLIVWLIESGRIDLHDPHTQMIVLGIVAGSWALLFIGRTLLKYGHTQAGQTVLAVDDQVEAIAAELEKRLGLALPIAPPATPPVPPTPPKEISS